MCNNPTNNKAPTKTETETKTKNQKRIITLSELHANNAPNQAWTSIHGRVVDITKFASRHPGGDLILLSAGKDGTVLFETYHPRGVPTTLLDKLEIGKMKEGSFPPSYYTWSSPFYTTLKSRVITRLESLHLPRRGTTEIQIKSILLLLSFTLSLLQMYRAPSFLMALMYSITMGISASFVGTCIQHDGNHGAFSSMKWLNKMAGWTLDMIGASAFTWEFQHMLGHHPYTNLLDGVEEERKEKGVVDDNSVEKDQESDPDVFSSFPLMRMHPLHPHSSHHRYQHLYAPLLFSLMTIAKVFQQDFEIVLSGKLYHIDATCRYGSFWNVVRFWLMKVLTLGYMLGIPCWYHGVCKGLVLFLVGHLVCGEMLATMFIVNHVIEGVAFASKGGVVAEVDHRVDEGVDDEEKKDDDMSTSMMIPTKHPNRPYTTRGITPMEQTLKNLQQKSNTTNTNTTTTQVPFNDWAAVQCQTSVNWSAGSWFWNHFSGGLSHQIEHHLFPSICHTNYVYIQDVVQSTCEEFGVPYQAEESLWVAYGKMLNHLKFLGRNEDKKMV